MGDKIVDCTFRIPGERVKKTAGDVPCGFDPTVALTRFERNDDPVETAKEITPGANTYTARPAKTRERTHGVQTPGEAA